MGDAPIFYTQHIHYHGYFYGSGGVLDDQGPPLFRLTQGSLPITWTFSGVPPGFTAPAHPTITARLSGSPTTAGTFTCHATATNAFGSDSLDLILDVGEIFDSDEITHPLSVSGPLYELECTSSIFSMFVFLTAVGVRVNYHYNNPPGNLSTWQNLNLQIYAGPGGPTPTPPPLPHYPIVADWGIDNSGFPQRPGAAPTSFTPGNCYTEHLHAFAASGAFINYDITTCFVDPWHYTPPPAVTMGPRSYYQ